MVGVVSTSGNGRAHTRFGDLLPFSLVPVRSRSFPLVKCPDELYR
jgi:hypothetical protein